jgi:hypothetical protein
VLFPKNKIKAIVKNLIKMKQNGLISYENMRKSEYGKSKIMIKY